MACRIERFENRMFFSADPALFAAGGGHYLTAFDPGTGSVLAEITAPAGQESDVLTQLTSDSAGNVFAIDSTNQSIIKVDSNHLATTFIPAGNNGPIAPRAVAVDDAGDVYAIDSTALYHYSPTGTFINKFITDGSVSASLPWDNFDLSFGPDGLAYVTQVQGTSSGFSSFRTVRYFTPEQAEIGSPFFVGTNSNVIPSALHFDFGFDGKFYAVFSGKDFYSTDTSATVYDPASGASDRSFTLTGYQSESITLGAGDRLFVVSPTGGIDVASAVDGTNAAPLVAPGSSAFGSIFYSPPPASTAAYTTKTFTAASPLQYNGSLGPVTLSLKGPGTGTVIFSNATADPFRILLTGTTTKTRLAINGPANISALQTDASLHSIIGLQTDVPDGIKVGGQLSVLQLHDVGGDFSFAGKNVPLTISVHTITAGTFASTQPIAKFSADTWDNSTLTSNLDGLSAPRINSIQIAGNVSARIRTTAKGLSLVNARIGSMTTGSIITHGSIGSVVIGSVIASQIYAGLFDGESLLPSYTDEFTSKSSIAKFSQTPGALYIDSELAATHLGNVSLGTVSHDSALQTGAAARTISRIVAPPLATTPKKNLHRASDTITSDTLAIRIVTARLPG